ncbi:MAG: ATP-binding cassette, subfamily bacterial CydCD [Micromonosporaceae bacterium]|nr:ATP-binding cassette, subfamily bacterial CydCD [Micromonosporaceae bacterium]
MRPLDPRLTRYAGATRGYLAACVGLGLVGAGLIVAQATLLAAGISAAFLRHTVARSLLAALAVVIVSRALLAWAQEVAAHRSAAAVKTQLRGRLLSHVVRLGPGWLNRPRGSQPADGQPSAGQPSAGQPADGQPADGQPAAGHAADGQADQRGRDGRPGSTAGELTTLANRGVDALDDYFARYLPQLVLAAVVPVIVLIRLLPADLTATVTIAITLPLIPVFLAIVGVTTARRNRRQFRMLTRLAHHFLDVVAGLPTLKVFGRAKAQAETIRQVTDDYRRATMRTLRLAFLSSLVLELVATVSVALVAVGIGLRLVNGRLDLQTALLVLILAPEAYLPLRAMGTQFHASAEGLAAAEQIFAVLDEPVAAHGGATSVPSGPLHVDGVTVRFPGRAGPALHDVSLTVAPGEVVALAGPSGCGKSTLLNVLLGFVAADSGRVSIGGVDLSTLDPEAWRRHVAWVSQRPYLFAGTVADNVRLGRPDAPDELVREAARLARAEDLLDTTVGDDGAGLSAGQRQRVAIARALLCDAPLILLDEPTANLDGANEAAVLDAITRFARGRTVILVAHRPALLAIADRVIRLDAGHLLVPA